MGSRGDKECCAVGTYDHHAPMTAPNGVNVGIDRCLSQEIADLWEKGIKTIGCCCGHGAIVPYIQVDPSYCDDMERLGYEQQEEIVLEDGSVMGPWCFWPKTELPREEAPC